MNKGMFRRTGWFCIPASLPAGILCLLALGFLVTVFTAVDRHSHSASNTLYGVFPYAVCTFLLLDWVGRRSLREG